MFLIIIHFDVDILMLARPRSALAMKGITSSELIFLSNIPDLFFILVNIEIFLLHTMLTYILQIDNLKRIQIGRF